MSSTVEDVQNPSFYALDDALLRYFYNEPIQEQQVFILILFYLVSMFILVLTDNKIR